MFHIIMLSVPFAYSRLPRDGKMLTAANAEKGLTEIHRNAETGHSRRLGENGSCQKVFWLLSNNVSFLDFLPFCVCKHTYMTSTL